MVAYGERPSERGLVIMDTPGYDIESVSGMCAGGAQALIFSTGRGTPIGNPVMPVIKVTGNCETYARMPVNIDFDASGAVEERRRSTSWARSCSACSSASPTASSRRPRPWG